MGLSQAINRLFAEGSDASFCSQKWVERPSRPRESGNEYQPKHTTTQALR